MQGRALICPQCKNQFTVPTGETEAAAKELGTTADEVSPGGSDMAFFDNLASGPGRAAAKTVAKTPAAGRPGHPAGHPVFRVGVAAARTAAGRAKNKSDQMMLVYIGGGVAATVLVVVLIAVAMSPKGGSGKGKKKNEVVRFGLADSTRHQLFNKMITAVDDNGITKACKEEWFRLADEYKLDRKNLKDILDEGFDRKDWDQPAPAHITNKTRGTRMEWNAQRAQGGDPILAM